MKNLINSYLDNLKKTIDNLDREEIQAVINVLKSAREKGSFIYIVGNGGSAATASHFVCDFNKGISSLDNTKKRFKVIAFNDSIPINSAYSNDISYEVAYVEQLKNFITENDVLIGISGSGNSKNIIDAVDYANNVGATTIGLTGYNGGKLKEKSKYSINANVDNMEITEDIHLILCHLMKTVFICS